MQRTVEVLLGVGILLNLVKGADLLLRPHQQKWLQTKCDSLTLFLDYSRPVQYINKEVLNRMFWPLYTSVLLGIATFSNVVHPKAHWAEYATAGVMIFIVSWIIFYFLIKSWRNNDFAENLKEEEAREHESVYEKRLTDWFLKGRTIKPLLLRLISFASVAVVVCLLAFKINNYTSPLVLNASWSTRIKFGLVGTVVMLMLVPFKKIISLVMHVFMLGVISLIVLISSLGLSSLELCLKFLRGLMWRIAEYNKGAFAAILLILTMGLGVTELYLRFRSAPIPASSVSSTSTVK